MRKIKKQCGPVRDVTKSYKPQAKVTPEPTTTIDYGKFYQPIKYNAFKWNGMWIKFPIANKK